MALEYYTPGVYIEEVSGGSKPITAAPTNITGFIGETRTGSVNKPVQITSWADYFDTFIGYKLVDKVTPRGTVEKDANGNPVKENVPYEKSTELDWSVYGFFNNGGSKCFIVSVNNTGEVADTTALELELKKAEDEAKSAKDKAAATKKVAELKKEIESASKSPKFDLTNAIIGNDGGPNNRSGLHCFKDAKEVALLAAPGVTNAAVQQELLSYAEANGVFAILDAPKSLDELKDFGLSTDLPGLSGLSAKCASKQAAIYFPWVNVYDPVTKADRAVAPSGFMAGVYGRVDSERGVHKAPANEPVRLVTSLVYSLNDVEQESLNMNGINCIRDFSDLGVRIWGARTTICATDPEWRYINVRRLFNMVERSLEGGSKWAVFEPNDATLWATLSRNVTAFLTRIHSTGAFAGTLGEGFYVRCDASTNPQENIDAGIVTVEIGIAPVKPAEFVVFRISQKAPNES